MTHTIIDKFGNIIGSVEVVEKDGLFSGELIGYNKSSDIIKLLKRYEGYVNDQVLTILDEIEDEINSYGLKVQEIESQIFNIQLFGDKLSYELK
ncbi:MAG: hypothetical protein AAF620_12330 [Bacteroidota bacterium]